MEVSSPAINERAYFRIPKTPVYVLLMLSILLGLPALGLWLLQARYWYSGYPKLQAKTAIANLQVGLEQYHTEYGEYPNLGQAGSDTYVAADNHRLLDILRAHDPKQNRLKIPFFSYKSAKNARKPRDGYDAAGTLYDPWGAPYRIKYDTNGDGKVSVYGQVINTPIAIWSPGRDGIEVSQTSDLEGSDDVTSWQ